MRGGAGRWTTYEVRKSRVAIRQLSALRAPPILWWSMPTRAGGLVVKQRSEGGALLPSDSSKAILLLRLLGV